jgi:hypothetical protein
VDGVEQGMWVLKFQSGARLEGGFIEGKKHGLWVEDLANGDRATGECAEVIKTEPWRMNKDGTRWETMYQDDYVWSTSGRCAPLAATPPIHTVSC